MKGARALSVVWMAVAIAMATRDARAQPAGYEIVTHDDSATTRRIADDLAPRLQAVFAGATAPRRTLLVAIGPAALRDALARRCDCIVVSAYTSSQVYRDVVEHLAPDAPATTAVYAEPSPSDQLRLADLLYRRPARVAAILGRATAFLKPLLAAERVVVLDVQPEDGGGDDINRLLNRMAQTDVLLALPDSAVYNADNIRNILLSTYRHKQGVIGFSSDMVKAGALATTYSDIEDIDAQVAEVAARYAADGELEPPRFPRYFRTIINEGVARSLDLVVSEGARRFARPAPARRPASSSSPPSSSPRGTP